MADISENLAFAALLDSLGRARDSARSLALLRSDIRWIAVAGIFDEVRDKTTVLFRQSQQRGQNEELLRKMRNAQH